MPWPPLGKNKRRQRDKSAPRRHLFDKLCLQSCGQISPRNSAENSADNYSCKAQFHNRNTRRIYSGRVLAHSAQAKSKARAKQHPPCERDKQKRQIDNDSMA